MAKEVKKESISAESTATKPEKFITIGFILAALGPGVISAMAGNDAGGIATYSAAGAQFGFTTLWAIPLMGILLLIVQSTAARMGAVTGKGFAALIRERFGIRLTALAMVALLIGNTATTFSEFAGIASAFELFGIPAWVSVPISAGIVWALVTQGSYKRIEKIFLFISLVFAAYVVAAILAGPHWGEVATSTLVPHVVFDKEFFAIIIAMVGTTIAPWMMFLTQSSVVDRGVTTSDEELWASRIDVFGGTIAAVVIAWFIIVTTGTVLFPQGILVDSAQTAASALAPALGNMAEILFAAGLAAASFLAACVLPMTTAYVLCEAFGWEAGADFSWREAPVFKGVITVSIVVSAIVVIMPHVNLITIMLTAQFINGVALPVLLVFMALLASDKRLMKNFVMGMAGKIILWASIVIVTILSTILLVMQIFGVA